MPAEAVFEKTRILINQERGRPFILSAGCEITPLTPPKNLLAMREAAR
jgi:uroporphyrinogen-III decarboxylase